MLLRVALQSKTSAYTYQTQYLSQQPQQVI
jgi:hypothetical protein